ncbi:MAG: hypothetical protein R2791_12385 [Saprospiraceae bacterium]
MELNKIFSRRIDRIINPAVVVSNQQWDTVEAEIREYVFTDDLIEKIVQNLNAVTNKRTGKTFGSTAITDQKIALYQICAFLPESNTRELAFEGFLNAVNRYDSTKAGADMDITTSNIWLCLKEDTRLGRRKYHVQCRG